MAINVKFDLANNPELPTLILATRSGNKLGQLDAKQIELSDKFNEPSEISFILNKYVDGKLTNLWNKVVDFKLIYCKEWDMWFEITVELDEATETVKTVSCVQLGQAELSQPMLYDIEINTEDDIDRDDYDENYPTVLYRTSHIEASLLHRLLKDKAPHYSIRDVDSTIKNIQRSFSFDNISIYDALQEVAEEIGCIFVFHSNSDENGNIQRVISAYDLQQNCNDCGYRGEFTDECPKCGSKDINYGYGEDTTIFVTADELASEGIQLSTDADSVKNCFKLEAGDDLMTATVRNCNPNGTDYIWYFSDDVKSDMSDELIAKIDSYNAEYDYYSEDYSANLNSSLVSSYNSLVSKYSSYNEDLLAIPTSITGYSSLMNAYYNVIDLSLYLESGLMPSVSMSGTNASSQAALLTSSALSPVAVSNISTVSVATANSAVLAMAKLLVKDGYKVTVNSSSLSGTTWRGNFLVSNYSDDDDTAVSSTVSVAINGDFETYVDQKLEKELSKDNTDDLSVTGLFKKSYSDFCAELKKYALNPLTSLRDASQACIDILISQGVATGSTWSDSSSDNNLTNLYNEYYNKLKAIESEMGVRENEIYIVSGEGGLAPYIEKIKNQIQKKLDFENYLGTELWEEFCTYRREDEYSNSNYISDGLNNVELFDKANEFIVAAKNEIYKSAELQHSISTTLKNLLAIPKFKSLVNSFENGNWIRVRVDDKLYKLRLLSYDIDFDDFENIPVEFSDVTKIKDGITDVKNILIKTSTISTSYDSVQKQAKQGNEAQSTISNWYSSWLDSDSVQIQNGENGEITISNSILCRSYDDITGTYSPEQLKITHNVIAYTDDDWVSVKQAVGKHEYVTYDSNSDSWNYLEGYGMSAEFVTAGQVMGSVIVGGEIYSSNYHKGTDGSEIDIPLGTYINLQTGDFELGGKKIIYDSKSETVTLNGVTIEWATTNPPAASDIDGLEGYLNQMDGMILTYSQSEDPSLNWTDEEKEEHVGDLWFNPDDGLAKRWTGDSETGYSWEIITDSELRELAQSKAQIFTTTPTPPYYIGDLWVQGSTGDILHCITTRESGSYKSSDWVMSSKYTDDTALEEFINGEYADELELISQQIDAKAETWYQSTDPSSVWTTTALKKLHVGDLWYDTTNSKSYIYGSDYTWKESAYDVPDEVYDAIDGKATLYTTKPSSQEVNDLLIPTTTFTSYGYNSSNVYTKYTFTAKKVYKCTYTATSFTPRYWEEIAYTDDTLATEAKSVAEEAKELSESLETGLGFTQIGSTYVISPVIAGGTLLIGDETGTYAKIDEDGTLTCTNANVSGNVVASSLQGSSIYVKGTNGTTYATLYAGTNSAGTTAFELNGSNGIRLITSGNIWMSANSKAGIGVYNDNTIQIGGNTSTITTIYGTAKFSSGTAITSDRNKKHDIEYDIEKYEDLFDSLKAVRFKYNDGTSDRYHIGLIANDVKDAIENSGLTTQEFAGYCEFPVYAVDEFGNSTEEVTGYTCALRYSEFIALNIKQIQQLKERVAVLEEQISSLNK